jgi:hypothetical protein
MSKRFLLVSPLAAVAVLTFGGWRAAQATLMRAMDLPELVAAADRIVVADVLSTQSAWDSSGRTIHTTVAIAVRESWKGPSDGSASISLRQLGGTVGEIEMTVHGSAKFAVGERALLFLRGARLVGMSQGKRSLRWEPARRRWLVAPADRAHTIPAVNVASVAQPDADDDLDTLRTKVRALVRN